VLREGSGPPSLEAPDFNQENQELPAVTWLLGHDLNGNLVQQHDPGQLYFYDAFNRLRSAADTQLTEMPGCFPRDQVCYDRDDDSTSIITYDALNRRVARSVATDEGSTTERYVYDGFNLIEAHRDGDVTSFVHGAGVDEHIALVTPQQETYHYVQDVLGNVVALTDTSGAAVEAYLYQAYGLPTVVRPGANGVMEWGLDDEVVAEWSGLETASMLGNPFLYTGQPYDADVGLYYYRARYYDPAEGRFLSRDPIGVWGDTSNLGNAYAYVGNDPLNQNDPLGLCPDWICRSIGVFGHFVMGGLDAAVAVVGYTVAAPTTGLFMMAACVTDWASGGHDICDQQQAWWFNTWMVPIVETNYAIGACLFGEGSCNPCEGHHGWDAADCWAGLGGQVAGAIGIGLLSGRLAMAKPSGKAPPRFNAGLVVGEEVGWISRVARGHAFTDHAGEWRSIGIQSEAALESRLMQVVRTGESKVLHEGGEAGKMAYWDNADRIVVIKNPYNPDGGTAFIPDATKWPGRTYFDQRLW
jgi:RHS repeat-associated protein